MRKSGYQEHGWIDFRRPDNAARGRCAVRMLFLYEMDIFQSLLEEVFELFGGLGQLSSLHMHTEVQRGVRRGVRLYKVIEKGLWAKEHDTLFDTSKPSRRGPFPVRAQRAVATVKRGNGPRHILIYRG
jgi:hypothetical protein